MVGQETLGVVVWGEGVGWGEFFYLAAPERLGKEDWEA